MTNTIRTQTTGCAFYKSYLRKFLPSLSYAIAAKIAITVFFVFGISEANAAIVAIGGNYNYLTEFYGGESGTSGHISADYSWDVKGGVSWEKWFTGFSFERAKVSDSRENWEGPGGFSTGSVQKSSVGTLETFLSVGYKLSNTISLYAGPFFSNYGTEVEGERSFSSFPTAKAIRKTFDTANYGGAVGIGYSYFLRPTVVMSANATVGLGLTTYFLHLNLINTDNSETSLSDRSTGLSLLVNVDAKLMYFINDYISVHSGVRFHDYMAKVHAIEVAREEKASEISFQKVEIVLGGTFYY